MLRVMRYLGIMLFAGCFVGLMFTLVFMFVLSLSGVQLYFSLAFFGSLTIVGGFAAFFNVKEREGV